jgi:hypothetical protein
VDGTAKPLKQSFFEFCRSTGSFPQIDVAAWACRLAALAHAMANT